MTTNDDAVLGGLDVALDVDEITSYAGIAICVARAIMHAVTIGDLALAQRIGKQYRLAGPQPPGFGGSEPWDPAKHATATIVDVDGEPVCVVDSGLLVKP